jgi:hypothetical protein
MLKNITALFLGIIALTGSGFVFSPDNARWVLDLFNTNNKNIVEEKPIKINPNSDMIIDQFSIGTDYIIKAEQSNKRMRETFFYDLSEYDDFFSAPQERRNIELYYWVGCSKCAITHKKFKVLCDKLNTNGIKTTAYPVVINPDAENLARFIFALDEVGLADDWVWMLYENNAGTTYVDNLSDYLNKKVG